MFALFFFVVLSLAAPQIFQYPPPPSPSCYAVGEVFFPPLHPHMPPRTPHTSLSYDEEPSYYRQTYPAPSTPQPMPPQPPQAPQSAPPLRYSHSYPQQSPHLLQHHAASAYGGHAPHPVAYYATYTPPPTPNNNSNGNGNNNSMCASTSSFCGASFGPRAGSHGPGLASTPMSAPAGPKMRLQRTQSDAARR